MRKGMREGKKEGRKEGAHEKAIETAINAISMGLSTEQIVKLTGLSIKEIKKLQNGASCKDY
jgi:predicted transposase/invertase (TIGR01784 family)